MKMLEHMAKYLYLLTVNHSDARWECVDPHMQETVWKARAKELLDAMMEPSEAMYDAGYDATRLPDGTPQFANAGYCIGHSGNIWRAMIAAALKDK